MAHSTSEKRPWLAALLAILVTGLGHLYLRRWRRAIGWLVAVFVVSWWLVEPAALEALASGESVDLIEVGPVLLVGLLSVVDAYFVAHAQNKFARSPEPESGEEAVTRCPNCGKEVDPDLDFCQWCSTSLDG